MTAPLLVLGAADVRSLLNIRDCIAGLQNAFAAHEAGRTCGPVSSGFPLPGGSFHAKAAALRHQDRTHVVVKANVNLPGNPAYGRPTIQGALILLDGHAGHPLAIMDSMALTSIRTACVAALAATHLSLPDATTITIVGCGEQGEWQLRAMTMVRPLQRAFVLDRDFDKARRFAARLGASLGFPVEATSDLSRAMGASHICVTCTTSHTAIVGPSHLHAGLFIAAVGADNPAKQEIDPKAMARCRVVVDSLPACAAGGDLHHAIDAGVLGEDSVYGELSAIVSGRLAGRTDADEMFVFDSTGTALQDVAAALVVYDRALATGCGASVSMAG